MGNISLPDNDGGTGGVAMVGEKGREGIRKYQGIRAFDKAKNPLCHLMYPSSLPDPYPLPEGPLPPTSHHPPLATPPQHTAARYSNTTTCSLVPRWTAWNPGRGAGGHTPPRTLVVARINRGLRGPRGEQHLPRPFSRTPISSNSRIAPLTCRGISTEPLYGPPLNASVFVIIFCSGG